MLQSKLQGEMPELSKYLQEKQIQRQFVSDEVTTKDINPGS